MNKVEIGLAIGVIGIVLLVGCMIYYEQTNQLDSWLDEHPGEIPEFGPPAITDLRLFAAIVIIPAIAIFIILKFNTVEEKEKKL